MTLDEPSQSRVADRELSMTRLLQAPRSLVYKVWTQPQHFAQWLGPKDFTTLACQMNVEPGGIYRACIRSPKGQDYWMQGVYREVVEPERLVFTFAWEDDNGQPKHETLVTVTFTERDGKTELSFHQAIFETVEGRDSHRGGWSESFDRLSDYLVQLKSLNLGMA